VCPGYAYIFAIGVNTTPIARPRRAPKVSLSAWITPEDDQALDDLVGQLFRASRHLVAIAALRAGLAVLRDHPEDVLDLLADEPRAKHVHLRADR
jgi:hypothetical protein